MIVNTESLIIGMDIGKYHHMVVALRPDGIFRKPVKITNDLKGYRELLGLIAAWNNECKTEKVMVGMESTGHYWEIPARWLIGQGITVVQVNKRCAYETGQGAGGQYSGENGAKESTDHCRTYTLWKIFFLHAA